MFKMLHHAMNKNSSKLIEPTHISSDFELAAINAIKEVFNNTEVQGCYFHLVQNMWKHLKDDCKLGPSFLSLKNKAL